MTIEELEKANNIKRELDIYMQYKSFANSLVSSYSKPSMRIEMDRSTDWSIFIGRDDTELIRELFETMKAFSEKRITELNNQFAKL